MDIVSGDGYVLMCCGVIQGFVADASDRGLETATRLADDMAAEWLEPVSVYRVIDGQWSESAAHTGEVVNEADVEADGYAADHTLETRAPSCIWVASFVRLGRSYSIEVWADSENDARNKAKVAYPGTTFTTIEKRRSF